MNPSPLQNALYVICFANASQCTATHTMIPYRTLHIYGSTCLFSEYCDECHERAFVVDGRRTCCGGRAKGVGYLKFKVEVDKSNSKRRRPGQRIQVQLLHEQENRCFYCNAEFGTYRFINGELRPVLVAWDHTVPFCYDGNNLEFVASCGECNRHKGARMFFTLEETRKYLQKKLNEKNTTSHKVRRMWH